MDMLKNFGVTAVFLLLFAGMALPVGVTQLLTVTVTCGLVTDVASIDFGSVAPGITSSEFSVRVNNTGSVSTTVNLTGSNWRNSTTTFGMFDGAMTHFNYTDSAQDYAANMMPLAVGANKTIGSIINEGSRLVYYKVYVPSGTNATTYIQDTSFSTVC